MTLSSAVTPSLAEPALFQASVPVFLRYLGQLERLLAKARAVGQEGRGATAPSLLDAALAPDMLPFATQVEIACNFTLRASFPLAGRAIPPYGDYDRSWDGLQQRLERARSLLTGLSPADFEHATTRTVQAEAGQATHAMPASDYLLHYASPNFFFHVSAAYAILRHAGVAVGKADFDGFHAYGG